MAGFSGASGVPKKYVDDLVAQSTALGGKQVQWGHQSISLAANSQTEITVSLPQSYQGGNNYMAVVTPVVYTSANLISYVIREKVSASFVVRIHNNGGSAASGYLDWITIGI